MYGLNFPSQMVVLTSCEGGYGPLSRGEGVMSIARAFRSAGAQSVLCTAWEVDGRVALPLMKSFYNLLAANNSPSEALRTSTINFLKEAPPELVHPHYWGAFTFVGKDKLIHKNGNMLVAWTFSFMVAFMAFMAFMGILNAAK